MTESKHTPGPWTTDGPCTYVSTPGCMVYAPTGNGHLVAECNPQYAPNQQANARLIAAAPDLLAACQLAQQRFKELDMDWLGSGPDPIEAAIKKATGAG